MADWLQAHPGVEIICRDRAEAYASGASSGAPEAVQVADRFHLLRNLADTLQQVFEEHRSQLMVDVSHATQQAISKLWLKMHGLEWTPIQLLVVGRYEYQRWILRAIRIE